MSDGYWVIERQWPNKPEWGWQVCETFPGSQEEAAIRERCQHWQRKNGGDIEFRYSFFVRAGALRDIDLLENPTRGEVRDLCRVLRLPLKEGAEKEAAAVGGFVVGESVSKVGGDYRFDGVVVARFKKLSGAVRYVVEDDRGVLHIYSAKNLKKRESATTPE